MYKNADDGLVELLVQYYGESVIRPQYHFRHSSDGLLAWDVRRLIELSKELPVQSQLLTSVKELNENYWYAGDGQTPTCHSIIEHMQLIDDADLTFAIILCSEGRLMDGMHRVCKAVRLGKTHIPAIQFTDDPKPDFVGIHPDDLPYD